MTGVQTCALPTVDIKTAYLFMEDLKKVGFVKNIYEVYCMECNKSKGIFLESLTDFDDNLACDFCNESLSVSDDIIVLYKVLHVWQILKMRIMILNNI